MPHPRTALRSSLAGVTGARRGTVLFAFAIAALGLLMSATISSAAAQTAPGVVYDSIGPSVPDNFSPSQPFNAEQVNAFGDLVTLAPGGQRQLTRVSVALSSQACETGSGTTCATTPGATFTHPLTMTLYNMAGTTAAPTVGSVLATHTATFTIPFRPSASPTCADPALWSDDGGTTCWTGIATVVDFVFPAGTNLPDTLIWAISYNTDQGGSAPLPATGPYDSLNLGLTAANPTVGTDVAAATGFISSDATGDALIGQPTPDGRPMARIEVQVPPTTTTTSATPTTVAPTATPTTPAAVSPTNTGAAGNELAATGGGTGLPIALLTITTGLAFLVLARLRRA